MFFISCISVSVPSFLYCVTYFLYTDKCRIEGRIAFLLYFLSPIENLMLLCWEVTHPIYFSSLIPRRFNFDISAVTILSLLLFVVLMSYILMAHLLLQHPTFLLPLGTCKVGFLSASIQPHHQHRCPGTSLLFLSSSSWNTLNLWDSSSNILLTLSWLKNSFSFLGRHLLHQSTMFNLISCP